MTKKSSQYINGFIIMLVVLFVGTSSLWCMSRKKNIDPVKQDSVSSLGEKAVTLNAVETNKTANDTIFYFNRGNECIRNRKYKDAIKEYDKAIALDPNNAEAYFNRGLAKNVNKDFWGSVQDCSTAIKLNPKLENAFQEQEDGFYEVKDK